MPGDAARHLEPMSVEELLAFGERRPPDERWELIDGVPFLMTGGTAAHSLILGNLFGPLDACARQRGCRAMTSFLSRISDRSAFEPGILVRCGPIDLGDRYSEDPVLVLEVLSPSTMRRDRVLKFEQYRGLPTLRQIVFVYQDSVRVESWLREGDDWQDEPVLSLALEDSLAVPALGTSLPLREIYEGALPPRRRG